MQVPWYENIKRCNVFHPPSRLNTITRNAAQHTHGPYDQTRHVNVQSSTSFFHGIWICDFGDLNFTIYSIEIFHLPRFGHADYLDNIEMRSQLSKKCECQSGRNRSALAATPSYTMSIMAIPSLHISGTSFIHRVKVSISIMVHYPLLLGLPASLKMLLPPTRIHFRPGLWDKWVNTTLL